VLVSSSVLHFAGSLGCSVSRATKRWHAEEEVVDDITAVVVYF